ncbi:hypothetical protein TrRE_jg10293 [Triparma retinervis]|uniref:Mitochondrial inner membrane protease subunit n=1 Tax=Triparma retinervis TaxID=2557542 RepID=A0A9W7FBX6_9STRA|nr:hypothetical protein TrRE_jg10293 [Triparma retinervis]
MASFRDNLFRNLTLRLRPTSSSTEIPYSGLLSWLLLAQLSYELFDTTYLTGRSMEPTFNDVGDVVLVDKFAFRSSLAGKLPKRSDEGGGGGDPGGPFGWRPIRGLSRGDVVIASGVHSSSPRYGFVCKRVAAVPGDVVHLDSLYHGVNDPRRGGKVAVPDGRVWLEGDNPPKSRDSRHYGVIPASLIIGRVVWRLWPWGPVSTERPEGVRESTVELREDNGGAR